ncbi:UNVERIFIED_CONTAM: hypothetical protein RMT77_012723 [Armadillidium vulgare]
MRTDGTKNLHYTSVGTDCNDPNRNPTSNTISSKSDEENSFNDFDSDDTDADPNFVDSSSESSGSSSSDIEYAEREMKERAGKRKVLFPCNAEDKTRKRKRNVQKWQKIESKLLRNCGKSYKSIKKIKKDDGTIEKTQVTREARKILPPCGEKCRLSCSKKFSDEERQNIFQEYWKMADLQRQRDFIAANMTTVQPRYRYQKEDSRRRLNTAFSFDRKGERTRVCKQFFTATLGISGRMVRTVEEKRISAHGGVISTDCRGKHGNHATVPAAIKESIRKHIRSIPKIESHYCRARTSKEYIQGDKTVSDLYRDYKKMCEEENLEYGNYLMYYTIFNQEFNLAFFIPKKDQCELCTKFQNGSNAEKETLLVLYENHLQEKDLSRIEKENDKKSTNIVAVYDLQAVLPCPQGDTSTFYYVSKLNVFNFTIFQLKTNFVNCYVWHEGQANRGSVEITSCVWRYLEQLHHERGNESSIEDKSEVIFYSDNCAGQNKNKNIVTMYRKAILTFKWIKSITHKYLITGHSQNEGDSAHSNIEKQIRKARKSGPIYVPDHYVSLIRSAKKTGKPYTVHELCYDDFYDFQKDGIEIDRKNTDKEIFKISDVKIFRIAQDKPNELLYKNSYGEQDFKVVLLTSNLKTTRNKSSESGNKQVCLQKAYTVKRGISEAKKTGLLRLIDKNVVPRYYFDFYNNL